MSGGSEVWIKYRRARPPWQAARGLREVWRESMLLTAATGVQQSVDHIVPLIHPFVCGLHCRANLEIVPLSVNIAKSNNPWPDMWAPQSLLF